MNVVSNAWTPSEWKSEWLRPITIHCLSFRIDVSSSFQMIMHQSEQNTHSVWIRLMPQIHSTWFQNLHQEAHVIVLTGFFYWIQKTLLLLLLLLLSYFPQCFLTSFQFTFLYTITIKESCKNVFCLWINKIKCECLPWNSFWYCNQLWPRLCPSSEAEISFAPLICTLYAWAMKHYEHDGESV